MPRFRILALAGALAGGLLVPVVLAVPAYAAGTTYTWNGQAEDTSWTDPANWTPNGVPGTGDSAVVIAPSDDVCHAHVTDVPDGLQLANFTMDERLFMGDPNSPCLSSITGGSMTVTNQLVFHAGTIDTPVTIPVGASATVTPGAAIDTTRFSQAVTVQGALTLANNTAGQSLSLTGSPGITVTPGATLTTQGDNHVSADCCLSPAHVTNQGTMSVGAGTLQLDAVELDQDATLSAPATAHVISDFAPQTAGAGAKWKGAGSWQLDGTAVTASGVQTLAGGFHWILGGGAYDDETLAGRFTLGGSGSFTWDGGTIHAAMTIAHTVTATADGSDGGDTRYLSGLDESTTPATALPVTVHGVFAFRDGAGYYGTEGSKIAVASDGQLELDSGTSVGADCCTEPSTIVNNGGTVVVPAASSGADPVSLDNVGFRATGGTTSVGANGALALSGGASGLLSTTTISGGGALQVSEPMTVAGTDTVAAGTVLGLADHGTLASSGTATATLAGAGTFTWKGGGLTGKVTIATGAQSVSGTINKLVQVPAGATSATVTFAGPTTVAAGTAKSPDVVQTDTGATVSFTGTLALAGNVQFFGGRILTSGHTTVRANANAVYFTGDAAYTNSGTLTVATGTLRTDGSLVQSAGSTSISTGATVDVVGSSSAVQLHGGSLSGTGTVDGALVSTAGTVAPGGSGVGTLTVTGGYTSGGSSTLAIDLTPSGTDLLAVGASAIVAGTLTANDAAGYVPASGATATALTATQITRRTLCVQTTGAGAATEHWTAAVHGGTALVLTSVDGESPTC